MYYIVENKQLNRWEIWDAEYSYLAQIALNEKQAILLKKILEQQEKTK